MQAMIGLAKAVNNGSKLCRANLVKGSDAEKSKTPKNAKAKPERCVRLRVFNAMRSSLILREGWL